MSLALASPPLGLGLGMGLTLGPGVAVAQNMSLGGMNMSGGELAWAAGAGASGMWQAAAPWQTLAHAVAAAGAATPAPSWHRPPPSHLPMTCT